ncbi:MAG TPA: lytic transglycosylase domain-containing protein [Acidobacteriaceae bacterium]|nr:lytic transglycosylase domain-containing protein [Acidobacteriaceae bacterium]
MTPRTPLLRISLTLTALTALASPRARALEHITLRSGAEFNCTRHEPSGTRIRLYLASASPSATRGEEESYIEVAASSLLRVDIVPEPKPAPTAIDPAPHSADSTIPQLLTQAGTQHNIDADLLASIVHAESNFNPRALSRAGAQGLMQLMPATASTLGVHNAFAPDDNISGGSAYLDQLLTRYHNDIALAAAAYNAGPAAVDRFHGIPPYRETRAYVTRVIREFNRRKRLAITEQSALGRLQLKAE